MANIMNTIRTTIGVFPRTRVRRQLRTREAILEITDIFEQEIMALKYQKKDSGEFLWLPSAAFLPLMEKYSQPTIKRAKKALGIRTRQWQKLHEKSGKILRIGQWKWSQPMRTVEKAIEELHDEPVSRLIMEQVVNPAIEEEKAYRIAKSQSIQQLKKLMIDNNYDVPANTILPIYRDMTGFSRRTAFRVKKLLGIRSLTAVDGEWRWVWPCDEVKEWLSEQLKDGNRHAINDVFHRAKTDKNWTDTLIRSARIELGSIKVEVKERKIYWYDFNSQ